MIANAAVPTGFAHFTHAERMREVFQEHASRLFSRLGTIVRCTVLDVRYKSYRKAKSQNKATLSVCYRLDVVNTDDGGHAEEILYAKIYRGGTSAGVWADRQVQGTASTGQSAVHVPELDMIVWRFPNDPLLPHLAEVFFSERAIQHLPFAALSPRGPSEVLKVTGEVVNYRPEVRCTTRFTVQWGSAEAPRTTILFGKTFGDDAGREIYRRMQDLWRLAAEGGLLVPQPLGYAESIKTVWQAAVAGIPLLRAIDASNFPHYIDEVAKGLALLHGSELTSPVTITIADHLREAEKKLTKLAHAMPRYRKLTEWLRRHLRTAAAELGPCATALIHGDFHIAQLLAQSDRVAFFDFDEFAIGDPHQDIANFIVDLHFRGLDAQLVQRIAMGFIACYERHRHIAVSDTRLDWHALVQFINKAYRAHVQQHSQLEQQLRTIRRHMRNWRCGLTRQQRLEAGE